jgi:hypothetical protein
MLQVTKVGGRTQPAEYGFRIAEHPIPAERLVEDNVRVDRAPPPESVDLIGRSPKQPANLSPDTGWSGMQWDGHFLRLTSCRAVTHPSVTFWISFLKLRPSPCPGRARATSDEQRLVQASSGPSRMQSGAVQVIAVMLAG